MPVLTMIEYHKKNLGLCCYAQPFTHTHSFYPHVFHYHNNVIYICIEGEGRERYDIKSITCQNSGIERCVYRILKKEFKSYFVKTYMCGIKVVTFSVTQLLGSLFSKY